MKFAMNHEWKFESWQRAFIIGFLQVMVALLVEIVNSILLFTNNEVLDIIRDFLACVIISEFDDYYFEVVRGDPIGKLITEGETEFDGRKITLDALTKMETTTSVFAQDQVPSNELVRLPSELVDYEQND